MTDLRERVEDDRGLIKKIQLIIPGYRGYRQREDARIADSLLRTQIADAVKEHIMQPLELCREEASRALELDIMNNIAAVITKAKTAEAKVRHAEQGYSGISAGVRIEQEELNTLYELDLSLLTAVQSLGTAAKAAADSAAAGDFAGVSAKLSALKSDLQEFISILDKRINTAAGILVEA
ncbi:MAG TPA: hypothetical protein O0X97_04845 [Methanocorpusculum sp.]|nr:hypothetical protein [Methanocorpusculum sp.]